MTQLFTCFDDAIDDGVPAGWDKKWAIADGTGLQSMVIGPAASSFVTVKRRVLRMLGTNMAGDPATRVPGAVAWANAGSLADFQAMFGVCMYGDSTVFSKGAIFRFRCSGQSPLDRSGYYISIMTGDAGPVANTVFFGKTVAGVDTNIASAVKSVNTGSVQWARVVVSGTHIQVRVWDASAAAALVEPVTWDIDTNDSSVAAAGWMGFEPYWDAISAGPLDINFLSIATGADVPVVPRTNTQFKAWLAQGGVERRYLVEMSALGYAANGGSTLTDIGTPAYTKRVNVYLSNGGYVSQAWDFPPNQLYNAWITKIPTYKRDMGQALSGKASLGLGTLVVANPADATGVGVRDRWLRMRWKRNYVKVYMGDPSWPKHDFRCVVLGRLQRPVVGADVQSLEFTINDLSDVLVNDINQLVYAGGAYVGQRQPALYGSDVSTGLIQVEPPQIDPINLVYQISRRTIGAWAADLANGKFVRVYDNQVSLWKQFFNGIGSNDAATFTYNAHGMVDGWLYVAYGAPPSGVTAGFAYYVRNTTANTFQLSTTRTGSIIALTPSGGGDNAFGFGYYIDADGNGALDQLATFTPASIERPALLQLVSNPAGRVTVAGLQSASGSTQVTVMKQMAIDAGISAGAINVPISVYDARQCMYYVGTTKAKADAEINTLAKGLFMYYGFAPDGFFEYDLIGFTGTTQVSLTGSDIKAGSMKLLSVKQPTDFGKAQIDQPWFLSGGAFQTGSQAALQGKVSMSLTSTPFGYPDGAHPLDTYPQLADMDQTFAAQCFYTDSRFLVNILYPLLQKPVGIYSFVTRATAMLLRIGQSITVTLPREEWKNWSAGDPASPDNAGTGSVTTPVAAAPVAFSPLGDVSLAGETESFTTVGGGGDVFSVAAVVLGIEFNPSATDPYPVTLTVARQIVGYWPAVDVLDGDVLQTLMLEEDGVTPILEEDGVTPIIEENMIV